MTIRQFKSPCFVLDPSPWDDDEPHYETWAEASEELSECRKEHDGDDAEGLAELARTSVKALPAPCWIAVCDTCGDGLTDEEWEGSHFEAAGEVEQWMVPNGWTMLGIDGAYCRACSPEAATVPPPSPGEQEAAGQLVIPGVLP